MLRTSLLRTALRQCTCVQGSSQTIGDSWVVRRISSAALNKSMELELPFGAQLERAAEPFAQAIAQAARQKCKQAVAAEEQPLFVPELPRVFWAARLASHSELLRSVLVVDTNKPAVKPRLSWYNPYDATWIPSGWFTEGLQADVSYYFGDVMSGSYKTQSLARGAPLSASVQPNGA